MVRSLSGPGFLAFGAVVCWVGYALWRSPHLDWRSLLDSGFGVLSWAWDEVSRIAQDPLAVIGLLVMVVGAGVLLVGVRKVKVLVFGR
jgi:hypothetical protein